MTSAERPASLQGFTFCPRCSGGLTRSPFVPDHPPDSPICAACFYEQSGQQPPLLTLDHLDDLDVIPDNYHDRLVDWHGDVGKLQKLPAGQWRIEIELPCSRCGANPRRVFLGSGLHNGAWPYAWDDSSSPPRLLANLRDDVYVCDTCHAS